MNMMKAFSTHKVFAEMLLECYRGYQADVESGAS